MIDPRVCELEAERDELLLELAGTQRYGDEQRNRAKAAERERDAHKAHIVELEKAYEAAKEELRVLSEEVEVLRAANDGEPWAGLVLGRQRDEFKAEVERLTRERDEARAASQMNFETLTKTRANLGAWPGNECVDQAAARVVDERDRARAERDAAMAEVERLRRVVGAVPPHVRDAWKLAVKHGRRGPGGSVQPRASVMTYELEALLAALDALEAGR